MTLIVTVCNFACVPVNSISSSSKCIAVVGTLQNVGYYNRNVMTLNVNIADKCFTLLLFQSCAFGFGCTEKMFQSGKMIVLCRLCVACTHCHTCTNLYVMNVVFRLRAVNTFSCCGNNLFAGGLSQLQLCGGTVQREGA